MSMSKEAEYFPFLKVIVKILLPMLVLSLGVVLFMVFSSFRKPPAQAEREERAIPVEVVEAQPQDVQIELTGFGEVKSISSVPIAPEVSGRVTRIHPKLEVGEVIPTGEVMFQIEPRDYEIRLNSARSALEQANATLRRLKEQAESDKQRLKTLERTRDLALSEFQRVKELYEKDKVGTKSNVESVERIYNQALDAYNQLEQVVDLYPLRIKEAEEAVKSAESQVAQAELNLSRTVVRAPFNARVKNVNLEVGQYVTPGVVVLSISDDSVLEISVPLDAKSAVSWLPFVSNFVSESDVVWFPPLEPRECEILWTEDKENHKWMGILHRIEKYDQKSRTVYVVVRVEKGQLYSKTEPKIPLVEGMFCQVRIPGKLLNQVYKLPESSVTFDGVAYIVENSRLKYYPVSRIMMQGDYVIVSGLEPGMKVIVTRLLNPLENTLVEIKKSGEANL
ncbi:MAG: biotin/lipoyl-binding protein [Candidatus Hydrogenedentes bacterium]|nr:biotin/lipoyl-binding protein [Candidatus Hydrogenedentota bacterium]